MGMTREEIIEAYESAVFSSGLSAAAGNEEAVRDYELLKAGLDALHAPTREQVEKMRGEWIGMTDDDGCTWFECSRCEHGLDSLEEPNHFCPACGSPMTDEAVDIVLERWKEAVDGE